MKALILVKHLCLRHVLARLPCLLSTFPLHKQFQAAVIQPPMATNLLYLPLFFSAVVANHWGDRPRVTTDLSRPALRGVGGSELGRKTDHFGEVFGGASFDTRMRDVGYVGLRE